MLKIALHQKLDHILNRLILESFEKDMLKWAKYLIKEKNKIADSEVISFLVDMAGDSIVHLNNEIHKICID